MKDYVHYKRKNRSIYAWNSKLYTPVTLETKNQFDAIARRYRMSQAELGAVIVMHYLKNRVLSAVSVREYKTATREARKERLRKINAGEISRSGGVEFTTRLGEEFNGWFEGLDD